MENKELYRVSFFLALAGLTLMYSSTFLSPEEVAVSDIGPGMAGEKVKVSGTVTAASGDQHFFFNLSDGSSEIQAVQFDTSPDYTDGENVTVTGEVTMYRGSEEIIVESIESK